MTVAENVALPLRECTSLPDDEIDKRVADALAAVELTAAADKYPSEISGGMQKRAGLARAIVRRSDIVLYDEPTSGLDPVTSITINGLIKKLNKELGITSIVVTHDLQGAFSIADRIMLLKGGKAEVILPPEDFAKSQNKAAMEFVAAMKGTMQ
jgi:phospholipid/cholesterol/gamma-HCH transport system ATP-binding protein